MKIQIDYYTLSEDKEMGDCTIIPQNQELILIKTDDDGLMFFETINSDDKKLFWANKYETVFTETVEEDWSEEKIAERNNYINGEFL